MYILKSLSEGLRILGFDKDAIKSVSKEKDLEEIFLSTLFMNYLIVLLVYLIGVLVGGYSINGRDVNMPIFFGLLMIYPFTYNLIVYVIYGFFGVTAEMLDSKKHVKPLISVGFHTAIVYAVLILLIMGLSMVLGLGLAWILLSVFFIYFIYTMFLSIATIYNYSFAQSLTVLMIPFLVLSLLGVVIGMLFPSALDVVLGHLFI